jgi:hypothetical protein
LTSTAGLVETVQQNRRLVAVEVLLRDQRTSDVLICDE